MSEWIKTLGKDSLVYGIGFGVSRFLQIIILPIIAQTLSLSEFGYYSNYVIFYSFAGGLFIFGLDSAVTRFFFDSEDKRYHQQLFSSAFYFILLLSIASVCIFSIFASPIRDLLGIPDQYSSAMTYVLLCIPAVTLNGFLLSWFKWKREKAKFLFNSAATVALLLVPLLVASKVSFIYIFQVIFWSQLFIAIFSCILAGSYIRFYFRADLMRSLLWYGFPWMLVFLFGASRTYLDRMFLTSYLNDDSYGLYNFSVRIATLLSLVITAFDMSFGPLAFSIWNQSGAPRFFSRLQSLYVFVISAFACSICIAAPMIIQLLGGQKYEGAEKILPLLLFAAIPLSLVNFSNLGAAYAKKSIVSTVTLLVGLVVVLFFNILLTKHYLQYGAAIASLIGHTSIVIAGFILSSKYYQIPFAYAKDAVVLLLFFFLSIFSVNFNFSGNQYEDMLGKAIILIVVVILLVGLAFKDEYKKALTAIKAR